MIHSQLSPPKNPPLLRELPQPFPVKQESSRMIQIQLHALLLLAVLMPPHPQESPHPQLVAVKSLILIASRGLFMLYSMRSRMSMFPKIKNDFKTLALILRKSKIGYDDIIVYCGFLRGKNAVGINRE